MSQQALIPNTQAPISLPFDTSILAGSLRESSRAMYARDIAAYLAFAGSAEAALEAATFARWRTALAADERAYSPHTINRMLSAVKRLMAEAALQGHISHETAESFADRRGVKVRALKERLKANARTAIAPEEMRRMAALPDTRTLKGLRDAALLHTLASSGWGSVGSSDQEFIVIPILSVLALSERSRLRDELYKISSEQGRLEASSSQTLVYPSSQVGTELEKHSFYRGTLWRWQTEPLLLGVCLVIVLQAVMARREGAARRERQAGKHAPPRLTQVVCSKRQALNALPKSGRRLQMATLTTAIQVSVRGGLGGAQRAVPGHRWLVRWNEDGSYTLLYLPDPPAAYELKSWRFAQQGELVEFARIQGWQTSA